MVFNSLQYALFLPTVVLAYWASPVRVRTPLLVVASYVFYGAWDWRFLSLLVISTVVDYSVGRLMATTSDERRRRALLAVSLAVNLGILGFFKYFGFFVDSAVDALEAVGLNPGETTLNFVLPVGISFYTFQTMSYTIDVYRRRLDACRDLPTFALYVAFFPQLVAGPIERAHHLLPQLSALRAPPRGDDVASALALIGLGLFKKVVLADQVAPYVDEAFADPAALGSVALVLGVVGFAVQIYGDFSGYTDIARGSARLLSVDLMHNFRQPYLSANITEFWRRWHISLSEWLRDYLYIPLGGNRHGRWTTYRNLMITMLLGGLWHGAAWTFVLWGAIHGAYLAVDRMWQADRRHRSRRGPGAIPWVVGTFALVCFAWIFFRAASVGDALDVILGIVALDGPAPSVGLTVTVLGAAGVMLGIDLAERLIPDPVAVLGRRPALAGGLLGILAVSLLVFSGAETVPFIYFQF